MRSRSLLSALFLTSGILHFARPRPFEAIVPDGCGDPVTVVRISGAAEIAGAVGLLVPGVRRPAGLGLMALLLAIWPANIGMALEAQRYRRLAPAWVWWLRVPLQIPLLWWVERVSRPDRP